MCSCSCRGALNLVGKLVLNPRLYSSVSYEGNGYAYPQHPCFPSKLHACISSLPFWGVFLDITVLWKGLNIYQPVPYEYLTCSAFVLAAILRPASTAGIDT